jgi:3',5'-cyclic AMP phosphodiesterase CpdA
MTVDRPSKVRSAGIMGCFEVGLLVGALAAASGCSNAKPDAHLDPRFGILAQAPDSSAQLSEQVVVLADTHLHHLYGDPTFVQTNLVEDLSWTAVRTPQQDLYGPALQRYMLAQFAGREALIHLGDAADIPCEDEYDAFVQEMTDAVAGVHPWFWAPGNHDGYFFGESQLAVGSGPWLAACRNGSRPVDKPTVLRKYLSALGSEQGDPGAVAFGQARRSSAPELDDSFVYGGSAGAMLQSIHWHIDDARPWRTFVVQRLDLTYGHQRTAGRPYVTGILLDTTAFERLPLTVGFAGSLTRDEVAVAERLASAAHDRGDLLLLFGHHDYAHLDDHARATLERFHTSYGAALYISAHDHDGKWRALGKDRDTWPELNLGAMIDAPIELRQLSIRLTKRNRVAVVSPLVRLDELWSGPGAPLDSSNPRCTQAHAVWEAQRGQLGFYISYRELGLYRPVTMQLAMLDTMLQSYQRYFELAKASDAGSIDAAVRSGDATVKIETLRRLVAEAGEAGSHESLELRDYRLCQAWWGSKYARLNRRLPNPTDTTILLPAPSP